MNKRFPKEIILEVLHKARCGTPLRTLRREYGFSDASYYYWRAKYGSDPVGGRRTMNDLEAENRRLKILLAEAVFRLSDSNQSSPLPVTELHSGA